MKIPKSSALNWALILAVSGGMILSGCKQEDFGPDIEKLQSQIDANKSAIDQLKDLVGNGKYVKNVSTTATGIKIEFSDGQTVELKNGTDGTNGTNGTDGKDGKDGKDATTPTFSVSEDGFWVINGTKTEFKAKGADGKDGKDGKDGQDGKDGENGQDGQNGQDGISPEITIGADGFWHIDGNPTTMRAYPGAMAVVEQAMFYEVTFTDAVSGATTEVVRLPRVSLYVSGITFLPKNTTITSNPVMVFPRIVDNLGLDNTLFQGSAELTYKINPASVDPSAFVLDGLVGRKTDQVPLFRAGAAFNLSTPTVSNGQLMFTATPNGFEFAPVEIGGTDPKSDFLALQVKNLNKQELDNDNSNIVTSDYVLAREERIQRDEIDLHKVVSANRPYKATTYDLFDLNTTNASDPTASAAWNNDPEHFTIGLEESYNLSDSIRAFFHRVGVATPKSFDDNGLAGYQLKFKALAFVKDGVDQTNDYLSVASNGVIKVKPSPQGGAHTAALGRTPIVKVSLYAPNGSTLLATSTVKILITENRPVLDPVSVTGKINLTIRGTDYNNIGFSDLHLDEAYNKTGLSKEEFDARYTFTPDPSNAASFALSDDHNATNRIRVATIAKTVKAGTYTVKGKFTAAGHPDVNFVGTITLNKPNYTFVKVPAYWDGNSMKVTGREEPTGDWSMVGVLPNAWLLTAPTSPSPIADVQVRYVLDGTHTGVTINNPGTIGNYEISLANTAAGRKWVDGTPVKVKAIISVNGTDTEEKSFTVQFRNPVKALVEDEPNHHLIDKSTTGGNTIELRHTVKLLNYNNDVLYDFTYDSTTDTYTQTKDNAKLTLYGVQQPFTFEFVGAKSGGVDIDLNPASNPTQHIKLVDATVGKFEWVNNGEDLQGDIELTFKVTAHNKWNQGEVAATKGNVEKEYNKIKLKKNPNL